MASEEQILTIFEDLNDLIHGWEVTPRTLQIWMEDLEDIPDQVLAAAFRHFRRNLTSAYAPKPLAGDLRKIALEMVVPDWQLAWEELVTRAAGPGVTSERTHAKPRPWRNPLIPEILPSLGGLQAIAEADARTRSVLRVGFEKAYSAALERRQKAASLRALNGPDATAEALPASNIVQISEARIRQLEASKAESFSPLPAFDPVAEDAKVRAKFAEVRAKFKEKGFGA